MCWGVAVEQPQSLEDSSYHESMAQRLQTHDKCCSHRLWDCSPWQQPPDAPLVSVPLKHAMQPALPQLEAAQ